MARRTEVDAKLTAGEGESLDSICGGRVQVLQRRQGYRFNLDPVLLAHFAAGQGMAGKVMDLGAGSGVISLILARKFGLADVTAVELQEGLFGLCERNVRLNACERQVTLVRTDLRKASRKFPGRSFAHLVCNPPYRAAQSGRVNPELEKAVARHELTCSLEDVAKAARYLLQPRGLLHMVYPAARLWDLAQTLRAYQLEPRVLRLVHPLRDRPAKLALVTAQAGAGAALEVLAPLVLHREDQEFTVEVSRMLNRRAPPRPVG